MSGTPNRPVPPLFIVVEGGEGVGKTTQVGLLSEWLTERGVVHVLAREPGGTPLGEAARGLLLDRDDLDVPPEAELFLMLAARAAFVRQVVRPALPAGVVVLADRFALSTLAYQGYGRGLDLARIREANELATGGLRPDLYVVLDVPVAEGSARRARRSRGDDRIEREGEAFLNAVRDGYLALAKDDDTTLVVNARGEPPEVQYRIRRVLAETFPAAFGSSQPTVGTGEEG